MVCCKITGGFSRDGENFSKLFKRLSGLGGVISNKDIIYFGSDEDEVTEKTIRTALKRFGFSNSYIEVFDVNNQPKEDEYINGWLTDWLVKMEVKHFNKENQAKLRVIKQKLDELDQELDKELAEETPIKK